MATFHYQIVKTTWGISVTVIGDVTIEQRSQRESPVRPWELRAAGITPEDRIAVEQGLTLAVSMAPLPEGSCLVLTLHDVSYHLADYQPEGLTCAIVGLVCTSLGFPAPTVDVRYDATARRYMFDFPAPVPG